MSGSTCSTRRDNTAVYTATHFLLYSFDKSIAWTLVTQPPHLPFHIYTRDHSSFTTSVIPISLNSKIYARSEIRSTLVKPSKKILPPNLQESTFQKWRREKLVYFLICKRMHFLNENQKPWTVKRCFSKYIQSVNIFMEYLWRIDSGDWNNEENNFEGELATTTGIAI